MKKVLLLILIFILTATIMTGCKKDDTSTALAEEEKMIAVEVENPRIGSISQSLVLSGKLEPKNTVTVIPQVAGLLEITDLRVKLGDVVNRDDILFTLDDESIRDQIEALRLTYEAAKVNYDRIQENFDSAKLNLERSEQLYNEGAISKQQFEQAQLAASSTQLQSTKITLDQTKLNYDNALKQLDNSVVKAPISGVISSINIQENGKTSAQPSLVITDISSLEVQIDITESMINKLYVGQEISLEVPSASDESLKGIVEVINPVPDAVTQLYKGKISVENTNLKLRPGMFARINVNLDEKNKVTNLPSVAVIEEDSKSYVFVVADNKAIKKEVKTGIDNGEIIEIISGLEANDKIIVKGQDFVKDGSKVKVVRGEN